MERINYGMVFKDLEEIREGLKNEMALVIKLEAKSYLLYGLAENKEDLEKLQAGASYRYPNKKQIIIKRE